ncbi:hypothetical protein [uncultured Anaerococcus sp.]|uniref:hypothetical protein n=1 Tax=uncultured Anaerococcus sp. TaxID=293428 RepID=UPI002803B3D8|nr:hypothetical protein [uncultured Anaerococcus sp.]
MDYLKASDMYKAIKIGGEKKPSQVYRIVNEEMAKGKRSYARSPRRAWYREKEKNTEAGILIFMGVVFLLLALVGSREAERIFGTVCLFILLTVGVLV